MLTKYQERKSAESIKMNYINIHLTVNSFTIIKYCTAFANYIVLYDGYPLWK